MNGDHIDHPLQFWPNIERGKEVHLPPPPLTVVFMHINCVHSYCLTRGARSRVRPQARTTPSAWQARNDQDSPIANFASAT
jgi:hypothetical protein